MSAFVLQGAIEAFITVPLIPMVMEAIQEQPQFAGMSEEELSDQASILFQGGNAIGCVIGPIVGGALNDWVHFTKTCDIMAVVCFLYTILFYFLMRRNLAMKPKAKVDPPVVLKEVEMTTISSV